MLDSLSPDTHHLRSMIKSRLHPVENSFVFPACHATLRAWSAVLFERTLLGQFELQHLLSFRPCSTVENRQISRSPAGHRYSFVRASQMKSSLPKRPLAVALVAAIRNCSELVDGHLCTGKLRHRRQLTMIDAIVGNDVRDDQVMLCVNRSLHVVPKNPRFVSSSNGHPDP